MLILIIAHTVSVVLILIIADVIQIGLFTGLRGDAIAAFLNALAISTLLMVVQVTVLRFLDRHEHETPWLLAAALGTRIAARKFTAGDPRVSNGQCSRRRNPAAPFPPACRCCANRPPRVLPSRS